MKEFSVGFQYVPPEFFSYLMSHLCCMAATFLTDATEMEIFFGGNNFFPLLKCRHGPVHHGYIQKSHLRVWMLKFW